MDVWLYSTTEIQLYSLFPSRCFHLALFSWNTLMLYLCLLRHVPCSINIYVTNTLLNLKTLKRIQLRGMNLVLLIYFPHRFNIEPYTEQTCNVLHQMRIGSVLSTLMFQTSNIPSFIFLGKILICLILFNFQSSLSFFAFSSLYLFSMAIL